MSERISECVDVSMWFVCVCLCVCKCVNAL